MATVDFVARAFYSGPVRVALTADEVETLATLEGREREDWIDDQIDTWVERMGLGDGLEWEFDNDPVFTGLPERVQ